MKETVLVVDDDPDVARFVEVNMRSAGYDVALGGDGEEAVRRALELRPDLVLLDVMMPKLDGFEVAQRLRRDPRTASSSIIMLTAKALSADKVVGVSSGADGWIRRPRWRRRLHRDRSAPAGRAGRLGAGGAVRRARFRSVPARRRGTRLHRGGGPPRGPVRFPLLSVSIGVASTANRWFEHYGDAVAVATEMKAVAKRTPGSSFAVDRRTS
jgi:CheY-like chemotaxis protein